MASTIEQRLVLSSRLEELHRAAESLLKAINGFGYDETERFAIHLALEEAVTNAIKHGNHNDPAKQITIEYCVGADQVQIKVCDEGPGFSLQSVPDPTLDENLEKPNGRGIMLMRAYMNEVTYPGKGNCVVMVHRRDPDAAAGSGHQPS